MKDRLGYVEWMQRSQRTPIPFTDSQGNRKTRTFCPIRDSSRCGQKAYWL